MEEITIISNYYPPEKGAAANRIEQLALKLHQNNYKVTVICPLGNYPKGALFTEYKGKFFVTETIHNITVKRLWIYPSVSKNVLVRILSILSFSTCLFFFLAFKKTSQKVVVQSPPLLLSFIAVFVLSLKKKKIILNVSDLWPLAAIELNALKKGSFSHRFSLFLEQFIYKKSTIILGQSNEIISHIHSFFPEKKCFLYRNYPDHDNVNLDFTIDENQPIKFFYAGLFGVAQGVLDLCKKIEFNHLNVELHLFGDGAEKNQILEFISGGKNNKIHFHGMLGRNELHKQIQSFDVALVPLTTRIYGSVPSKIFEYASLGFPVLYFGGGEGEIIVAENNLGWVAAVGNYEEINEKIREIAALQKTNLLEKRKTVFEQSQRIFDLNKQIARLIENNVF
jgi:glycosyltransferase involved in cell wall biosynthesis